MSRARVAFLTGICWLLAFNGSSGPAAESTRSGGPAARSIGAEAVARIVEDANPALSARESERIGKAVVRYAARYDLEAELVTAVLLVESGARPWARSPKGAIGLMQVMPEMLDGLALSGNATTIEANIEAGCIILAENIRRFGEADGISAYFWGPDVRGTAYLERVRSRRAELHRMLAAAI